MSRISIPRATYKFEHYGKTPVKLTPYSGGYSKKLFKDHYHKTPVKLISPDNVSDLIYGKCK